MNVHEYVEKMKSIQSNFLKFIDDDDNSEENYQNLIKLLPNQRIRSDRHDIEPIFTLILRIANDHHRTPHFFDKIEQILNYFKYNIKNYFSNFDIFDLFKTNKRILLYLLQEKIIFIDKQILDCMLTEKFIKMQYPLYFFPEIKPFIEKENYDLTEIEDTYDASNSLHKTVTLFMKMLGENSEEPFNLPENFEKYRKSGENEDRVCELIRNDMIEEFIIYVNKNDLNVNSSISQSQYETNSLILARNLSLIEYAAFFGSFSIFKYLYLNKAKFLESIWLFAIHGNNPEIIHFLEDNKQIITENHSFDYNNYDYGDYDDDEEEEEEEEDYYEDDGIIVNSYDDYDRDENYFILESYDNSYDICLKEAIKCHHNEIVNYLRDKYGEYENKDDKFDANIYAYSFHYCNYLYFPSSFDNEYDFIYMCKAAAQKNNYQIVEFLLTHSRQQIDHRYFENCTNLTQLAIPSAIHFIGAYSFAKCISLREITIPNTVTYIGVNAFKRCYSLTSITIPSSVTELKDYVFYKCESLVEVKIPSSVKKFGVGIFVECSSLKKIKIPTKLEIINSHDFSWCNSLKEIRIPSSVKTIKKEAFSGCTSLQKIKIPSSVISIGKSAFEACESLEEVSIPSSVKEIGDNAFAQCSSLKKITISSSFKLEDIGINSTIKVINI